MNFLGIGAWELVAILLIMLVFAGPKRMIHWSYVLGQHVAKFRKIWSETVDLVQKEFDDAGVGIQLPKEPPTRQSLNRSVSEAVKPITKPVQDTLGEVQKDLDSVKEVSDTLNQKSTPATPKQAKPKEAPKTASPPEPVAMGAWSGLDPNAGSNGSGANLGSWSRRARDKSTAS